MCNNYLQPFHLDFYTILSVSEYYLLEISCLEMCKDLKYLEQILEYTLLLDFTAGWLCRCSD